MSIMAWSSGQAWAPDRGGSRLMTPGISAALLTPEAMSEHAIDLPFGSAL